MDDQPVFTPMRASLNRPQLLMGGDRELVLLSGLVLALMAVSVMSFLSFLIAGASFMAIVAVLDEMHKPVVQALAPLGLHVLCEKPLATSMADCLDIYASMLKSWKDSNRQTVFGIGHVLRYSPHTLRRGNSLFSTSVTVNPARASESAQADPAGPPPATATSTIE